MRNFLIMGISFLTLTSCGQGLKVEPSDHYNGNKFVNPTLKEPFSPGIKDIYEMAREGRPKWPDSIKNVCTPQLKEQLKDEDFSITFINHATFLIQTAGLNIITDPVWAQRASPISWIGPKRVRKPGIDIDSLPHIDLILISHNHYDHLDLETLKIFNKKFSSQVLVPIGDKALVESVGFENVREMDWWDSLQVSPEIKITFTPQQHSSARGLFDRDRSLWGSYYIEFVNQNIFFGGDGGYSSHFVDIKNRLGAPDLAILGIGAYLPSSFMKAIHTSPAEAVQAHIDLEAKESIGMHYGTFQLASEEYHQPIDDLKTALDVEKISHDIFYTLQEGETKVFRNNIY